MTRFTAPSSTAPPRLFRLLTLSVLLGLLAAAPAALSQPAVEPEAETPAGRFDEQIEVVEVQLDVLATDRKGRVVSDLGRDDFIVEEEGRPVEITSLSFYTTRYEDADLTAVDAIPASRYFIFFFEDQRQVATPDNGLLRKQLEATRQSRQWVEREMQPSDWVAVVCYDAMLDVHQDFTQDKVALLNAIEEFAEGREAAFVRPSRRAHQAARGPSLLRDLPYDQALRRRSFNVYDAIGTLADASASIIGRKNLILFTVGFGRAATLRPGSPDPRYYPDLEQTLNDQNVAVYPIDLLQGSFDPQAEFMYQLATDTGGYFHSTFTNFMTPLRQISRETTGYYLLSYRSQYQAGEHGYREVKVKARNRKIRVRARTGYRYGAETPR